MTAQRLRGRADAPTGSTPRDAAQEITDFGSTVLRDVWSPEQIATLHDAITGFCDQRAAFVASGQAPPRMAEYHRMGALVLNWLLMEGRISLEYLAELFSGSFYEALAQTWFDDDRLYMAPDRIGMRNMQPPHSATSALPFHQDSYTHDKRVLRVLNCWIPLDPGAGVVSPGVEVVRHPGHPGFQRPGAVGSAETPSYASISIERERIVAEYGDNFLAPAFDVGDSLVFSQDVIHRTYVTPEMTQPRIGFEFRVFSMKYLAPWARADEVEAEAFPLF